MNNKEFGKLMEERTLDFAVKIIQFSSSLPNNQEGWVVRNQITKSGTSVGANYSEANRSRSVKDFIHKMNICVTEAGETEFWLKVIERTDWGDLQTRDELKNEASELIGIFTSAIVKLKSKNKR